MRATAIWARWQGGWRYLVADSPDLVIEIAQGHSGDNAEVVRKMQAELSTYGQGQTEVTVGIDPAVGDPVPGVDWTAGDQVELDGDTVDCEALTMTLDDASGQWSDVPQFGTILDEPEARIARTVRGIGGLNGGTSHLARPVASIPPPNVRPPGVYTPP